MRQMPSEQEKNNSEELLLMMGHVLAAWQAVEHAVFDLYRLFFNADHSDVAAVTFFSMRTFEARTRVVDALTAHFALPQQYDEWQKLNDKIRKLSKVRNGVAHGLVSFVGKSPTRKAMVSPSIYDIARFPKAPRDNDFLSSNSLKNSSIGFVKLAKSLSDFRESLAQDENLTRALRARPQRLDTNDQKYPLTGQLSTDP